MANHKKTPVFIRITASNKAVVCINPLQLSSFEIHEKATVKTKDKQGNVTSIVGDSVHLFFPAGTGMQYTVGVNISQEDFNYICATLIEFMYLNESEFKARSAAIETERMAEWNRISEENSKASLTPVEG